MDPTTQMIWILPGVFGVITVLLLLYWVWLLIAPGPRVQQPMSAPPIQTPKTPAIHLETDDTIIDRIPTGPTGPASMTVEAGLPGAGTIEFPSAEFRVGRFRDDTQNVLIALDEKSVSRSHALIRGNPQTGEYYIQDIGSRFGTSIVTPQGTVEKLNEGETRRVYNGTVVQFGSAVRVRINLPAAGGGFQVPDDFDPGMTRL